MSREQYELIIRRGDEEIEQVTTHLDLDLEEETELRKHLIAAVRRCGGDVDELSEYSMAVQRPRSGEPEFVYVAV